MSPTFTPAIAMPRTKTTYGTDGRTVREYDGAVCFHPDHRSDTLRGQVSFYIPRTYQVSFLNALVGKNVLEYFNMSIRPVRCLKNDLSWFTFKARRTKYNKTEITSGEIVAALKVLLDYLSATDSIKIIWKEGGHGYEIDRVGSIIRKWNLQPF